MFIKRKILGSLTEAYYQVNKVECSENVDCVGEDISDQEIDRNDLTYPEWSGSQKP